MKKFLIFAIAMIAVVALCSLSVLAEDTASAVAKIGETEYPSLQDAVNAAAQNDGTVVLTSDIVLDAMVTVPQGSVTLDLNGKTVSAKYTATSTNDMLLSVSYGAHLTVMDSVGTGVLDGSSVYGAIKLTNKGEVYNGAYAELTVNGGNLIGNYYAIVGNGGRHGTVITINGGTITATQKTWGYGIFHPQDGVLTINGGTIEAPTAVEMRAGELSITGGTITSTAAEVVTGVTDSGTTVSGVAVAVSQHTTSKPITVSITGGTLSSESGTTVYQDRLIPTYTPSTNIEIEIAATATVTGDVVANEKGYELQGDAETGYSLAINDISVAFTCLGYAVDEENYTSITVGYTVNHELIKNYCDQEGFTVELGYAFGTIVEEAVYMTVTNKFENHTDYTTFNVKIRNFTESRYDSPVALALYVSFNNEKQYVVGDTDAVSLVDETDVPTVTMRSFMETSEQ